ncbi:MAG: carbohydrate kinase family protein [Puniceicoccales bacterium]|jgi:fructose-1-phosphate kinase PfkB-like protein|nr:carbohydrate kinase family protein [Puniceicoccales bacterium]
MDRYNILKKASGFNSLVGFDGFIDRIVEAVRIRDGGGRAYQKIETIAEFAKRIDLASGRSTNIELFVKETRIGGNAVLMANALADLGINTRFIGPIGNPRENIFGEFSKKTRAFSLGESGETTAVEFNDGKILFGVTNPLDGIIFEKIIKNIGHEVFIEMLEVADLVAILNWTMLPAMGDIMDSLYKEIMPKLSKKHRFYFFDLADPEKRSQNDKKQVIDQIGIFGKYGTTVLSLNVKEAQQLCDLFGKFNVNEIKDSMIGAVKFLADHSRINKIIIHGIGCSACCSADKVAFVDGFKIDNPVTSTGGGDVFNAGFSLAMLAGETDENCMIFANKTSNRYVRGLAINE